MPRIGWQTIFIHGKPQWYGKPLKPLAFISRQGDIRRVTAASRVTFCGLDQRLAAMKARLLDDAAQYDELAAEADRLALGAGDF